jgi:iron complex outermembrane receptor protein
MFASYNRNLDIHAFDATGGYEWQHFHRTGTERSHGYYQSTFNNPALAGQIHNPEFHEWATESFLVSFFGRVNYRLLGRYLFTATLRADGSSRFAPGNQWGLFPSFAFAWNMHEEHFLQDVTWLSELKLRLGYGITGQQNIADNDYLGLIRYLRARDLAWYTLGERDPITGEHIYLPPLRPEPFNLLLTWESTTTYNVGLDFGLMRGRFTGSLDFYHRLTTNLLNEVEIPVMTNFRNMMMSNIGSLSNTGLELSLNAIAVHDRDLRWDIGLTAAWNTNKIESLTVGGAGFRETGGVSAGTGNTIQRFQQGLPAYTFFVYETRVNEHGFWEIVNQDDNPAINMNDLIPFHNPMPDVMLGLTSQWQFRKFDFSFSLRANIGNYVYNDVKAARMSNLVNIEREGAFTNVLIGTLEPFTRIEHSPNIGLTTNAFMIDRFVENASFLRCDNITLGYTFNKGKINGRVFGTVQNPFVITGYTGIDPEITNDGIDNIIFPRALTTIIGVSLQF